MDKPIPEAVQISDEMVERACKRYAFREDGATFPDDYSEYEVLAERKLMRDFLTHVLAERLPAAQQQGQAVAWCQLTQSGKVAFFDGKPMVMPGPVGNEHHPTPLYTAPQPMQQGGGEAIEDDYLSRLDWLFKQRGHSNDDPIYSMFSAFVPNLQSLTTPPSAPAGVEGRARELLAAEFRRQGWHEDAHSVSEGDDVRIYGPALRAIAAALAQQPAAVDEAMVERACKRYAFREDGAVWPDAYSEYEVLAERRLMREFLEHVLATQHQEPAT